MKIFISWSGKISLDVALALRDWLTDLLPGIKPFVSSEDLRKGRRWANDLAVELSESQFGIICLTPGTLSAPWILFEAGAISKAVEDSRVFTLLLDNLSPSQVTGPLSNFNHTFFQKDDVWKLVQEIYKVMGTESRRPESLSRMYDLLWPQLDTKVKTSLATAAGAPAVKKRPVEDMVTELLELVRANSKREATSGSSVSSYRIPSHMHDAYWAKFLEQVQIQAPGLRPLLEHGQLAGIVDQKFYVTLPQEEWNAHQIPLGQPGPASILNWAALQACGFPVRVEITGPPIKVNWILDRVHSTEAVTEVLKTWRAPLKGEDLPSSPASD